MINASLHVNASGTYSKEIDLMIMCNVTMSLVVTNIENYHCTLQF